MDSTALRGSFAESEDFSIQAYLFLSNFYTPKYSVARHRENVMLKYVSGMYLVEEPVLPSAFGSLFVSVPDI